MRRFAKQIIEDVIRGENVDLIVTIALVVIISALSATGKASAQMVSSITLAVLGLIAIALLVTRYKLEEIYRQQNSTNAIVFSVEKLPQMLSDFENAKEICMMGLILRDTTTRHFYEFKKKASQGTKFRTLIVNAGKVDMERLVKQFSRGGTAEQFRADFALTINQYADIRQYATNPKNVQLKLMDFVPSISLYIFPRQLGGGVIYVELYGYKSPLGSIPKFRVTERENPEWYKHFLGQFETIWQGAEEVS